MFRSIAVFVACLLLAMLTPPTAAEIEEQTQTPIIHVYQLDEQVVSGYLSPNGENSVGRVCDFDCASDKYDPYDLWIVNASYGSNLAISFTDNDNPNYVNLELQLCWVGGVNDLICRFLFYTDGSYFVNYFSWGESEQIYFRIIPLDGAGGDDTTYNIGVDVLPNRDIEPLGVYNGTFTASGWVCNFDCPEGKNVMDFHSVRMIKGDRISVTLRGLYDVGLGDRGYLSMSSLMEDDITAGNPRVLITMNERDESSFDYIATSSGYYSIRVMSWEDSNEGDNVSYQLSGIIDSTHRDILVDSDGDGWVDDIEEKCDSSPFSSLDMPLDYDGDNICDIQDMDDDNDGYSDEDEIVNCGESNDHLNMSDIPSDFDLDLLCDALDPDDDNDGVDDSFDACSMGAMNWISAVQTDKDADGCEDEGSNEDMDDDNDGVLDDEDNCTDSRYINNAIRVNENGCLPEQLDNDGDGWSNFIDDCINEYGASYMDVNGCPDADGDGYANNIEGAIEEEKEDFSSDLLLPIIGLIITPGILLGFGWRYYNNRRSYTDYSSDFNNPPPWTPPIRWGGDSDFNKPSTSSQNYVHHEPRVISSVVPSPSGRKCGICRQPGHDRRSCPKKNGGGSSGENWEGFHQVEIGDDGSVK